MITEDEQKENALIPSESRGLTKRSSALVRRALKNPLTQKAMSNSIGMEFVRIPPGQFLMGSNNAFSYAKPMHRVTIDQSFFMGVYEVTQAQWQAVFSRNPSFFRGDDNLPVENISWDDAQKFISKLNEKHDVYEYRLPTEAEWEYACRAGTTDDYYAPDLDDIAWYGDNSERMTHGIGNKQSNAFGLFDMSGNVWEWCHDFGHIDYADAPSDGKAWLTGGEQKERVLRGGSCGCSAMFVGSAFRLFNKPDYRNEYIGFRLVAVTPDP